jgi:hypothetical protein
MIDNTSGIGYPSQVNNQKLQPLRAGKAPGAEASAGMAPDRVEVSRKKSSSSLLPRPAQGASRADEPGQPLEKKRWTILQYSAADNNLTSAMVDDIKEMERVGSNADMNLVVQLDQGGSKGAARYFLDKHANNSGGIVSPALQKLGSIDMADPRVLADFVKWGMEKYPADHYALIISDHGGGWTGAISDDSHGGWATTPQLREALDQALKDGKKIDVLGFDACLMANHEATHELQGNADFLIASEQTEGADGWPYSKLLTGKFLKELQQVLKAKLNISPRDFAIKAVQDASTNQGTLPTMSAMEMAQVPALSAATDELAKRLLATKTSASTLKSIVSKTQSFYGYKDEYDFCKRLVESPQVADEELKASARKVMDAIGLAVIAEEHSSTYPGAHGLTIEMGSPNQQYQDLKLARDTSWDEAMNKVNRA